MGAERQRYLASLTLSFFLLMIVFVLRILFTFMPLSQRAPRLLNLEAVGATQGTSSLASLVTDHGHPPGISRTSLPKSQIGPGELVVAKMQCYYKGVI